ncbi:hypothetical protein GCM10027435_08570 [Haloparvum alkalitolerans]|uniref:hypothetical protein n=1 Tax=Haloparvum alkalitolerans TaxID=1042953 RepID=UPI003CE8FE45
MRQRPRRAGDAERNRSNWDELLNGTESLLNDSKSLQREIEGSTDRIEETWEGTAADVEETRSDVARTTDRQESARGAEADFDAGEAAGPPPAVSAGESVHGDPDLPARNDYHLSDPVTVDEVAEAVAEAEQRPAVEPETPVPYTEKDWFELHSDRFPIGEDVFPIGFREGAPEVAADDEERPAEREPADRRQRDENREGDT